MEPARRLQPRHIVTIVVALCAAAVLAPVGVMAAAGTLVTITDPVTGSQAKVDTGKVRVGDGSGNLTVDGAVSARDLDPNKVIYKSPTGGLNCGASGSGIQVATLDLSRYSRVRFAVRSGAGYQTIIQLRARAGSEVILTQPIFNWTVPAGETGHNVFYDPPTQADMIVYFCNQAQIFVYGLR
jgi:hypothetical protein